MPNEILNPSRAEQSRTEHEGLRPGKQCLALHWPPAVMYPACPSSDKPENLLESGKSKQKTLKYFSPDRGASGTQTIAVLLRTSPFSPSSTNLAWIGFPLLVVLLPSQQAVLGRRLPEVHCSYCVTVE